MGKLLFWLFIGWWLYPTKWILIDLPKAAFKLFVKQSNNYSSEYFGITAKPQEEELKPIFRDSSQSSQSRVYTQPHPQNMQSNFINADALCRSLPVANVFKNGTPRNRNFAMRDLAEWKCKNLTARTSLKNFRTFVAFDTETTGIDMTGHRIVEVSCVRFTDFVPTHIFTTLIDPGMPIPYEATAMHHITDNMVVLAPKFYEIIPSLSAFIADSPMVAHNAIFDVRFMYADGMNEIAKKKVYDTLTISRKFCPNQPNHKLETCCAVHGISVGNAHRSYADAMACGLLFVQFLMQNYGCRNTDELKYKLQSN